MKRMTRRETRIAHGSCQSKKGALGLKKTMETKNLRLWRRIDRLAWGIPLIFAGLLAWSGTVSTFGEVMESDSSLQAAALYILVFLFVDIVISAPFVFLWRAVSRQIKKGYLQRSTIPLVQELDYYRDKLTGLSPTLISMLADLQIEAEKDAAALILKYELMGVISTEGGRILMKNPDHPGLQPSDRALLDLLCAGGYQTPGAVAASSVWQTMAKQEALQTPYFKRTKPQTGCLVSGCLLPLLYFIGVLVLLWFTAKSEWYQRFSDVLATIGDDTALIHILRTDPVFLRQLLFFLLLAFLLFIAVLQPLISILRGVAMGFNLMRGGIKRTPLGEQMAEYVYGMKNFLHDFSNLAQADQESLVLWDDFLVYAVVLEENDRIIEQIMRKRNSPRSS